MKIVFSATLAGTISKADGLVDLRLKAPYSEIASAISTVQMMNREIALTVKVDGEAKKLGKVGFKKLAVDKDGESVIVLDSTTETLDMGALASMHQKEMTVKLFIPDAEE